MSPSPLAAAANTEAPLRASGAPGAPGAPGGPRPTGSSGTYPAGGPPPGAAEPPPAGGAPRRRVLIVEDDEPTRRLLAITLRRNYDVVCAADGLEGLTLAAMAPFPDLILTDVMMPNLDGLQMVR